MIDWSTVEMKISRTEQKKAHQRLQDLAIPMAGLSKKQLANLPVSEYFMDELLMLSSITSYAAKNRQIKRVGKMIIDEDRHLLVNALFEALFTPQQIAKIETWYTRLNLTDEGAIKQFVKQFNASEFNTIYQLLLWIGYAKHIQDDELLTESVADFKSYIKEVAILST